MEALTPQQTITALIALLAIVVSFVSLRRTSKVQEQQLRLQKKQEELTDLQLEALRKQAQLGASAPPVSVAQERADVRVDLEKVGRGDSVLHHQLGIVLPTVTSTRSGAGK